MTTCNHEDLVALARGDLGRDSAAQVEAHAASCGECGPELRLLRAETKLLARRAQPELPTHVWQGIERRLVLAREKQRRSRHSWLRASGLVAVAAAAALLLVLPHPRPELQRVEPPPAAPLPAVAALDGAEHDYQTAIATLEAEYAAKRPRLSPEAAQRYDEQIAKMRETVESTKQVASADVGGRRKALRAYSAYMRSMQAIVLEGDQ